MGHNARCTTNEWSKDGWSSVTVDSTCKPNSEEDGDDKYEL